jgi:hypothetical protein
MLFFHRHLLQDMALWRFVREMPQDIFGKPVPVTLGNNPGSTLSLLVLC